LAERQAIVEKWFKIIDKKIMLEGSKVIQTPVQVGKAIAKAAQQTVRI